MPNRYDVEDYTLPYGSVGGSMARAMQAEVLRRAQVRELQEEQARRDAQLAYDRQRQAQLDADKRENDRIDREIKRETLAATVEGRKATTAAAEQRVKDAQIKTYKETTKRGKGTKEQRTEGERLGLGHLWISKPVIGPETEQQVEEVPAYGADFVGPPAPPTTSNVKVPGQPTGEQEDYYLGTPEEQQKDEQAARRKAILGGSLRQDPRYGKDETYGRLVNYLETKAMLEDMGEDQLPPGQLLAPPKTSEETLGDMNVEVRKILAKPQTSWTPEEAAKVTAYEKEIRMKADPAFQRQQIQITHGDTNREDVQTTGARRTFMTDLNKDQQLIVGKLNSAQQLIRDAAAGGVNDSTLMTAFIQMKVGGYGSGLRLSDFETKLVGSTMTAVEDIIAKASRVGIPPLTYLAGNPHLVSDRLRKEMVEAAQDVVNRMQGRMQDIQDAQKDAIKAKSETDVLETRMRYGRNTAERLKGTGEAGAGASQPTNVEIK